MKNKAFINPFTMKGKWFKGNLHTHSNNSDGTLSPLQLSYLYKSNGYDFISITDHGKLVSIRDLSKQFDDFLFIPGEEVYNKLDLIAINIKEKIDNESFKEPQKVIDEILRESEEGE